jgi:hypothetical protein
MLQTPRDGPRATIAPNQQSQINNRKSTIAKSTIGNPQSALEQSTISSRQSSIPNRQSSGQGAMVAAVTQ